VRVSTLSLVEDVLQVLLHRAGAEAEDGGDVGIGFAGSHKGQHLAFPVGQGSAGGTGRGRLKQHNLGRGQAVRAVLDWCPSGFVERCRTVDQISVEEFGQPQGCSSRAPEGHPPVTSM
jgi:hypothetical protein